MAFEYKSIGWIGLGLMGVPMIENLINKTPSSTQFYIHDIDEAAVEKLSKKYPERAFRSKSSKELAEKSVCSTKY
jgi:3-hydroxyisobutyrate dehydrogenase-like beta-hydroxyacid dehydrogenase